MDFSFKILFIPVRYNFKMRVVKRYPLILIIFLIVLALTKSNSRPQTLDEKIHSVVSKFDFDFYSWTANAIWTKISQDSIGGIHYFSRNSLHQIVIDCTNTVNEIGYTNDKIKTIFSDPNIPDPTSKTESLRTRLALLEESWNSLEPFAESTLEYQVTTELNDLGLTTLGQPIPWVLYHVSPLPQNIIISRKEKIGTIANFILKPIPVDTANTLENKVDSQLKVSSLVVEIGGLADYPTMVMRTSALDWIIDTVSHEWIHLYLSQRPLGLNYTTPELRTMNETTASIAGNEIGKFVLEKYYPELAIETNFVSSNQDAKNADQPEFNFRNEMHLTRINVDNMLSEGLISEAEAYMEQRRVIFWQHGYEIRKLNQAYFAFYGSYADTPGGAAGEDPVGPAVRDLRKKSPTLKAFLDRISQMSSYSDLIKALQN